MTDFEKDINKALNNNIYIVIAKLKNAYSADYNYLFLTNYYTSEDGYISNLEFSTESDPKELDENEIRSIRGFLSIHNFLNSDVKILKLSYLEVEDD